MYCFDACPNTVASSARDCSFQVIVGYDYKDSLGLFLLILEGLRNVTLFVMIRNLIRHIIFYPICRKNQGENKIN